MEDTLNEIMNSVAVHKKMVELRDRAQKVFEEATAHSVNSKLSVNPGECNQYVIDLHKAYRIYRILTILLERGRKDDANNDLDRMYFELSNQI